MRSAFEMTSTFPSRAARPHPPSLILFSLGLMRRLPIFALLLLVGCATPYLRVKGPFASALSEADRQQIRSLAYVRHNTFYHGIEIDAATRSRVTVTTFRAEHPIYMYSSFDAVRRGKIWHIEERKPLPSE